MKKKILYIHGFMSSANGMTITKLRRRYSYISKKDNGRSLAENEKKE